MGRARVAPSFLLVQANAPCYNQHVMHGYRPDVKDQKRRYSHLLALRRLGVTDSSCSPVRENGVPWDQNVASVRDAVAVSDRIEALASDLKLRT